MAKSKISGEEPETLLYIARRARVLAFALPEPDKSRILKYVKKLEAEAASLTAAGSRSGVRRPTTRRRVAEPVRSPTATRRKKPLK